LQPAAAIIDLRKRKASGAEVYEGILNAWWARDDVRHGSQVAYGQWADDHELERVTELASRGIM
jgi:hypothetical protein